MKNQRRYFLDTHEHVTVAGLLKSTEKVDVDGTSAVFDKKGDVCVKQGNFIVTPYDLENRGVWVGERTIIFQDRTMTFYPKTAKLA